MEKYYIKNLWNLVLFFYFYFIFLLFLKEEPYLMIKNPEPGTILEGNDRYEGYCKDLADLIAKDLKFNYILKLVNDSKYGGMDTNSPSGWNGMVGELIRQVSQR